MPNLPFGLSYSTAAQKSKTSLLRSCLAPSIPDNMPTLPFDRLLTHQEAAQLFQAKQVVEITLFELPAPDEGVFTIGLRLLTAELPVFIGTRRGGSTAREWKKADSAFKYLKQNFFVKGRVHVVLAAPVKQLKTSTPKKSKRP